MASTYSNIKIQLMASGENNTTWGNVTNTNLGTAIEEAITGSADVAFSSADVTVTLTDTNATQTARNLRLNLTGTSGGARNLILGSGCQIEKLYLINNGLADAVTVKNTSGLGVAVPAGKTMFVYNNGTNVVEVLNTAVSFAVTGSATVGGTLAVTGATTLSGTFAANGGATLGDASGDALTINSSAVSIPNGLNFDSNTFVIDGQTLRVSDPLIYLAGNNYTSDIVDIGFIGNYVNATGQNVHTGLYREHEDKEYYLFKGYDKEPANNHIGAFSNNMTLAVLNADIRTSNLILGGANAIVTIGAAFTQANVAIASSSAGQASANAGLASANAALAIGNAAFAQANTARVHANLAFEQANTARIHANTAHASANAGMAIANASYAFANSAHAIANLAFTHANGAYALANSATAQAANADFLTTGTVPTGRISGSYTGITGLGTVTTGVWNGTTVAVDYGGTGQTTFSTNGILYGNAGGPLNVTAAGTEGQVLQASSTGTPQFGMLDGGTF
jgi:hypothetical protein